MALAPDALLFEPDNAAVLEAVVLDETAEVAIWGADEGMKSIREESVVFQLA